MNYKYLEKPCMNFCILVSTTITDPKDGREKILLSSFVSGGTGRLIFIDGQSGEGESVELPGDEGAWALLCLNNEKLLVGTCGLKGYLHCFDLKSRTWADPLRDEHESYIWNLTLGSDGMVYGGTWPGCVLLRYNPEKHTLENIGRISPNIGNQYSRQVYGSVPGRIFVNCGCEKPHVAVWDMETCTVKVFGKEGAAIKEVNRDFVCTVTGDELDFYDPIALESIAGPVSASHLEFLQINGKTPISTFLEKLAIPNEDRRLFGYNGSVLSFASGDIAGVMGQEYFILKEKDAKYDLKQIPVDAPPTQILTITSAPDGKIWGSSNFGQTIFSYDPKNSNMWNSPAVCSRGGEVYGMRYIKGKIFMTAYAGGDHIVYDPSKPWNQTDNINPVTLNQAGPDLIRPHGKSTVGPDGAFWTGWWAKYGVYGGGLSRVHTDTYEVNTWYDPIPEQEIESLAAGEKYLYFTTGGSGNGLAIKTGSFYLGVWEPAVGLIHKIQFPEGTVLGCVEVIGNYVIVCTNEELQIFDCNTMELCSSIKVPDTCTCIVKYDEEKAAAFCGDKMFIIKPGTGTASLAAELPGIVKTAVINSDGELYFTQGPCLYKFV